MASSESRWPGTWWSELSSMGPGRVQEPIQCATLDNWRGLQTTILLPGKERRCS
jgi:hypothetical protein